MENNENFDDDISPDMGMAIDGLLEKVEEIYRLKKSDPDAARKLEEEFLNRAYNEDDAHEDLRISFSKRAKNTTPAIPEGKGPAEENKLESSYGSDVFLHREVSKNEMDVPVGSFLHIFFVELAAAEPRFGIKFRDGQEFEPTEEEGVRISVPDEMVNTIERVLDVSKWFFSLFDIPLEKLTPEFVEKKAQEDRVEPELIRRFAAWQINRKDEVVRQERYGEVLEWLDDEPYSEAEMHYMMLRSVLKILRGGK